LASESLKTEDMWICYRCNLAFWDQSCVVIHKDISNHEARKLDDN